MSANTKKNSHHAIDMVTIISLVHVVFDKPKVVIEAKSAILQRFVAVKPRRYKKDLKRSSHTFHITRLTPF